jgi:hypothetical protein
MYTFKGTTTLKSDVPICSVGRFGWPAWSMGTEEQQQVLLATGPLRLQLGRRITAAGPRGPAECR